MIQKTAIATTVLLYGITAIPAFALNNQRNCRDLILEAEKRNNIPTGLLLAVAMTESGMKGQPNPLALNIAGRSYFGDSIENVARIVQSNLNRGIKSIDVGCMQINLKYHGNRFPSFHSLLNNDTNVAYGAWYLSSNASKRGSWFEGVMDYHNKTMPARRRWYGCVVWNNWLKITRSSEQRLTCGRPPTGSSTASQAPPINRTPVQPQFQKFNLAAYQKPTQKSRSKPVAGNLRMSIADDKGRIRLWQPEDQDPHAASFIPIRPVNWAGRSQDSYQNGMTGEQQAPVPSPSVSPSRVSYQEIVEAEITTDTINDRLSPAGGFHHIKGPQSPTE